MNIHINNIKKIMKCNIIVIMIIIQIILVQTIINNKKNLVNITGVKRNGMEILKLKNNGINKIRRTQLEPMKINKEKDNNSIELNKMLNKINIKQNKKKNRKLMRILKLKAIIIINHKIPIKIMSMKIKIMIMIIKNLKINIIKIKIIFMMMLIKKQEKINIVLKKKIKRTHMIQTNKEKNLIKIR